MHAVFVFLLQLLVLLLKCGHKVVAEQPVAVVQADYTAAWEAIMLG
jgi:hypothetical protein